MKLYITTRRDQEEGGELDSHEEVRHFCGSRRDQKEGGGAGPSRQRVLKFRLSNHRLPIQQRRSLGIPRDEIICTVCDSGEVGDEFHCLINCSDENVKRNRTKYVGKYYTHHPNVPKFVASWIWLQNLRMLSLLNVLVVSLSYFG